MLIVFSFPFTQKQCAKKTVIRLIESDFFIWKKNLEKHSLFTFEQDFFTNLKGEGAYKIFVLRIMH